jgi:TIGR03009 family protein
MRRNGLVLMAVVLALSAARAQGPAAPKAPPPKPAAAAILDKHLNQWEQAMRKVTTLHAQLTRIEKDKTFGAVVKSTGFAQYMRAGTGPSTMNLALLELRREGKTEIAEKFVCTGTYLYHFAPAQKEIRAYALPKPKPGQVADDNFMSFLFGMKAEEARRRYVLEMTKEDKWYVYVNIAPRFPADRADFQRAQLVLSRDTFLPRRLWFEHANGNEITWDVPNIRTGVTLERRNFDAPRPPEGWKLVVVPRAAAAPPAAPPPRVARPGSP